MAGLSAPVSIERDAFGVPTIRASTADDALFGLGYAHAQDRLWQMEFQRRIGSGRLAEILGARLVETDRFLRTIGLPAGGRSQPRRALGRGARGRSTPTRAGVNAFLASERARPASSACLRTTPEPFTPVDSLVWAKMMAWDLAGNATRRDPPGPLRARRSAPSGRASCSRRCPSEPTILLDEEWAAEARRFAAYGPGSRPRLPSSVATPRGGLRAPRRPRILRRGDRKQLLGAWRARARSRASRSSPTIRTSACARPPSGTSPASKRPASPSPARRCRGCRASSSGTTRESRGG